MLPHCCCAFRSPARGTPGGRGVMSRSLGGPGGLCVRGSTGDNGCSALRVLIAPWSDALAAPGGQFSHGQGGTQDVQVEQPADLTGRRSPHCRPRVVGPFHSLFRGSRTKAAWLRGAPFALPRGTDVRSAHSPPPSRARAPRRRLPGAVSPDIRDSERAAFWRNADSCCAVRCPKSAIVALS